MELVDVELLVDEVEDDVVLDDVELEEEDDVLEDDVDEVVNDSVTAQQKPVPSGASSRMSLYIARLAIRKVAGCPTHDAAMRAV